MQIEPYVYINKVLIQDKVKVQEFFQNLEDESATSKEKEGYYGFETTDDLLSLNYYRMKNTFDFSIDDKTNEIVSDKTPELFKAEIQLNFIKNILIVWGRPYIIKYLNTQFQSDKYFNILNEKVNFYDFYKNFDSNECNINEVSFKDIKVLDKYISVATLTTASNKDALYLIKELGAEVSTVKLKIVSVENDIAMLDINLEDGVIKLNIPTANKFFIENIKDQINNLDI